MKPVGAKALDDRGRADEGPGADFIGSRKALFIHLLLQLAFR